MAIYNDYPQFKENPSENYMRSSTIFSRNPQQKVYMDFRKVWATNIFDYAKINRFMMNDKLFIKLDAIKFTHIGLTKVVRIMHYRM